MYFKCSMLVSRENFSFNSKILLLFFTIRINNTKSLLSILKNEPVFVAPQDEFNFSLTSISSQNVLTIHFKANSPVGLHCETLVLES